MAKVTRKKITDLQQDNLNINKGSEYGMSLLEKSIQEVGLGRSVLTDKNGVLIAGNKTVEKAAELGLTDVLEVQTDGKTLVVVKRTDLDINTPMGMKAKILDNTVSKHNYVEDAEVAAAICEEADILNIHTVGLGAIREQDDADQSVSFSASKKAVIKIVFPNNDTLHQAQKDINHLLKQKYPDAILTSKSKS